MENKCVPFSEVRDERSQHWVVRWRVAGTPPFLVHEGTGKGRWLEGDRTGDVLLSDSTFMESYATVTERDLVAAGLLREAHCASMDPRRVAYDRGALGWKLAVGDGAHALVPVAAPPVVKACSAHDPVVWLPAHGLVLFPLQPAQSGRLRVHATRYATGESSAVEWRLR